MIIVALVIGFGFLAVSQIKQLNKLAEYFYEHPFPVSNAAAEFRSDIAQMRIHMLRLAQSTNPTHINRLVEDVAVNNANAKRQLILIQNGFLGDMSRVKKTSSILAEWESLRSKIIPLVHANNNKQAINLAVTQGSDIYGRISEHINYVSDFAHNKALQFEREAHVESRFMINNLFWIMSLIVSLVIATGVYVMRLLFRHNQKMEREAHFDALTGLLNRQQFYVLSEQAMKHADRYQDPLTAIVLDIDHFKKINDSYGHNVGDEVLRRLSDVLQKLLRKSDIICRWGGEEFVVLMPKVGQEEAFNIAHA